MIRLLLLAVVLVGGLIVGTTFADEQGYVLISVAGSTIENELNHLSAFCGCTYCCAFLIRDGSQTHFIH